MKLVIKRVEFLRLLTYVNQAIPSKSPEAQFLNFLLECKADGLNIIASDGTISAKVNQPLKDDKGNDVILNIEEGMIQAPAKYLLDFVANLKGETITLMMVDTNYLNVSDGISEFNLVTKDGNEYPNVDLTLPEEEKGFTLDLKDVKLLFDATSYAVATKGPKELFYGINIRAHDGKMYFMATDSYRMARYAVKSDDSDAEFSFTCPVKALSMVTNIAQAGPLTIYFDQQRALFVSKGTILSTRLIRGEFPSADRLIPPSFNYQISISTSEFVQAADLVKIVSSAEDKNSQVRLTASREQGITLSARSTNYGNAKVPLQNASLTMPEGEEIFEIGFNIDFATAAVKALGSNIFTFCFTSPTSMFMVKNDDPENIQIVTPIRVNNFN